MTAILAVVGNASALTTDDTTYTTRLGTLGHTVTLASAADAETAAIGRDVIIILPSISATNLGSKYKTTTKPIISIQGSSPGGSWVSLGLCTGSTQTSNTVWNVVNAADATAGGLAAGNRTIWSTTVNHRYALGLMSGAVIVAHLGAGITNRPCVFHVAPGQPLADASGNTAGSRYALSAYDGNLTSVTANFWAMFDASVAQAVVDSATINNPPYVDVGGAITVASGDVCTLYALATDDGTVASYAWTQIAGSPSVTLSGASTATPSFTAPNMAAVLTFRCTVTDNVGLVGSDDITVTVLFAANPIAPSGALGSSWTAVGGASLQAVVSDASDASYAESPTNPVAQTLVVAYTGLSDPGIRTGHVLVTRLQAVSASSASATIELVQGTTPDTLASIQAGGGTVIASHFVADIGTTITSYARELSQAEATAVTDYTKLFKRITVTAA